MDQNARKVSSCNQKNTFVQWWVIVGRQWVMIDYCQRLWKTINHNRKTIKDDDDYRLIIEDFEGLWNDDEDNDDYRLIIENSQRLWLIIEKFSKTWIFGLILEDYSAQLSTNCVLIRVYSRAYSRVYTRIRMRYLKLSGKVNAKHLQLVWRTNYAR